jgi:hypothetical protein
MLKQVESTSESPDRLLQTLEAETLARRLQRESKSGRRMAVLAGGLILILGGMTIALCALFSTLSGLTHERSARSETPAVVSQR